ncbi:MAG TPA: hypothetical protein VFC23_21930, partial [Thermoanaerobaculia bacterium]|nr:hypothetical protein [Thermoanaerobaculia bacterium]
PNPGTLRLPDPGDLSRDARVWSSWWPPGLPFLYAPLAMTGLPLAASLRLTSFLLFLAGSLGWLRLADRLALSRPVRLLYTLSLAGYAVTLGGAASLRSADVLAFAAAPWLIAVTLRLGRRESTAASGLQLLLGGLALGLSYWLKYSLFLAVLPLLGWLAWRVVHSAEVAPAARVLRLALLGTGFALPVAGLIALNLAQSEGLVDSAAGNRTITRPEDLPSVRPLPMAVALAGAPGLGLFQSHLWATHLVFFSDGRLPFLRGRDHSERLLLESLLGIPGTAALVWGLLRERRRRLGDGVDLALAATAGFYLILTAVSLLIRYNYLANEPRLAVGLMPFAQCLALSGGLAGRPASWGARAALALLLALFAVPLAFGAASFLKNDLKERLAPPYVASSTGLFVPEISPRNATEVEAGVAAAVWSPRDVVVLAGPAGWGSSLMMWLEFPQRTLPVSTWDIPLGARYLDAAELRGTRPLLSSQDLGVVLVVSRSLLAAGWLGRLEARFPQVRTWQAVPVPAHASVAVWRGDLEVR